MHHSTSKNSNQSFLVQKIGYKSGQFNVTMNFVFEHNEFWEPFKRAYHTREIIVKQKCDALSF